MQLRIGCVHCGKSTPTIMPKVDKPSELEDVLKQYLVEDYVVTKEDAKDLAKEIKKWVEGRIEQCQVWNDSKTHILVEDFRKALLGEE